MMHRIVTGVDGSESSQAALRWAVAEAGLRGAEVDALHAWSYPPLTALTGIVPPPDFSRDKLVALAEQVLDRACESLVEHHATVNRILMGGPPASCLLEAAKGSELLVVGCRGHGGFAGLLLGSVAQQVVHHAACPVVVVR